MQTVAVFSAPLRGTVYINGRFAGECSEGAPLLMPISPEAMLYAQFMPLDGRYIPCACAIRISGGEATGTGPDIHMISWPGNVIEIEFSPRSAYQRESEYGEIDSFPAAIIRGEGALLRIAGQAIAVPKGAEMPHSHITGACEIFLGRFTEGEYIACFSRNEMTPVGIIEASRFIQDENDVFRSLTETGDVTGHVISRTWDIGANGPDMLSEQVLWSDGGPKWPRDAENAAIAACQAAILGLWDEAEGYLETRQRGTGLMQKLCNGAADCISLPYSLPDSRRAVGIVRRISPNWAKADALYYRARPDGGMQGIWEIEFLLD